jgi:hypothetical protein
LLLYLGLDPGNALCTGLVVCEHQHVTHLHVNRPADTHTTKHKQ